jgi:hypothetical protein
MHLRKISLSLLIVAFSLAGAAPPATAGSWVRLGAGLADMAMDDVNDADLRFYEDDTSGGYNFADVGTGLLMDIGFGYDVDAQLAISFHWDRQWAKVKGTDVDVDGTLGLHANAFVGRLHWRPLRGQRWRVGLVGGMGPLFTDGYAKVTRGSVDYGKSELRGSTWSADAALSVERSLGDKTLLQVWAGWRWAKISEFTADDAPVVKEDGSRASLDYTGWTVRLGVAFGFGGDDAKPMGDLR